MSIPAGAVVPIDSRRRRRQDLLAQLREVDHWRRLVAARLDLAVAAVTAIDEPDASRCAGVTPGTLPEGLREILGLPECGQALPEASVLLRLRAAQRDLDEYARALRHSTEIHPAGGAPGANRRPRAARTPGDQHLHVVPVTDGDHSVTPVTAHSTDQTL